MKKITIITLSLLFAFFAKAQHEDSVLMTINDRDITLGEFERIYKKNSNVKTGEFDQKSIEDYLDLFINFKLKVFEAEALGYDTVASFNKELNGYRLQLEKPYLTDNEVDERLMKEAYNRMKYDVKASHILLNLDEKALPKDTVEVYNRIIEIRNKIINGLDFAEAAKQYSEDPSAQRNNGNLGYFTVFQMVYQFESAAFNTPVGEISQPVRTKFGYHLIKTTDKREAVGKVKVAHIMVAVPNTMEKAKQLEAKEKIVSIFDSIQAGVDFAAMAQKYSDDKGSAARGGELPKFGTGRMVPQFEKAAFALNQVNEVTEPIKTDFGWHIIKLLEKESIKSYDELKQELKMRVSRDSRLYVSKRQILSRLKKEYDFKTNMKNFEEMIPKVNDDIYLVDTWLDDNKDKFTKPLFTLLDSTYTQFDFAYYIKKKTRRKKDDPYRKFLNWAYPRFVDETIEEFERKMLPVKYPDFRYLMQEYHDGILLFELTDKVVWSKAVQDTVGLQEFYEKNKENYMWGERYEGSVFTCSNAKITKKVNKLISAGSTNDEILSKINKADDSLVSVETAIFAKGDNEYVDYLAWNLGSDTMQEKSKLAIIKGDKIAPQIKSLDEARGLITADYQNFLETEWIKELRNKYKVEVNNSVLKLVK
jgi:peptidyl-prolyl cis-trans isomerase SurA